MARKDRVPNPPKPRVQAPQRRQTTGDHAAAERRRRNLALLGGGAAVLLVLVLGIIFVSGRGGSDERSVLEDADCTLRSFPGLPGNHVQTLTPEKMPKWNSSPPTSGTHYVGTAIWDFYTESVPAHPEPAQPGARRHHHPLRQRRPEGADRRDPRVLPRGPERASRRAAGLAQEQDRAQRVDDARYRQQRAFGRPRLARRLPEVRRGCFLGLRRGAPLQGAGALRSRPVTSRHLSLRPGWRNWQTRPT